ncbi:MAG: hypothetical protein WC335_09280, partial [Candidatus Omnitrophota bacterium]
MRNINSAELGEQEYKDLTKLRDTSNPALLREVQYNYSYGKQEDCYYYEGHPLKDAVIIDPTGYPTYSVNLNWSIDQYSPYYAKSVEIDKNGLGVKSLDYYTYDDNGTRIVKEYEDINDIASVENVFNQYNKDTSLREGLDSYTIMTTGKKDLKFIERNHKEYIVEGTLSQNNISYSGKDPVVSQAYSVPTDVLGKDLITVISVSRDVQKTGVNMWWTAVDYNTSWGGAAPRSFIVKNDGDVVQENTYSGYVREIKWYNTTSREVELISISDLTGGVYEQAVVFDVVTSDPMNLLLESFYLPGGNLIAEQYKSSRVKVAKGILGVSSSGTEITIYDPIISYSSPILTFSGSSDQITAYPEDVVFEAYPERQQISIYTNESESLAPEIWHHHKSIYENGEFKDKSRTDIGSSWAQTLISNIVLISGVLSAFAALLFLGKLFELLRWRRVMSGLKSAEPLKIAPVVYLEDKDIEQPSYKAYGFDEQVRKAAQYRFGVVIERLKKGEKLEKIASEYFYTYMVWRKEVMGEKEEFTPAIEDLWLFFLIIIGDVYFHNDTPDFLNYLFHKASEMRQDEGTEEQIGGFVKAECERWYKILHLTLTTFKGIGGQFGKTSQVVPYYQLFSIYDLEEMFRTEKFIDFYDNMSDKEQAYADLISDLQEVTAPLVKAIDKLNAKFGVDNKKKVKSAVIEEEDYKKYIEFVQGEWLKDQPLFYKTYFEIVGTRTPWKGWMLQTLRSIYLPLAFIAQITLIALAWQLFAGGILFNPSTLGMIGLAEVFLLLGRKGIALAIERFTASRTNLNAFGKPVRPDTGYSREPLTPKVKAFRVGFWSTVAVLKLAWNALLFGYVFIAHSQLSGSVWMPSILGMNIGVNLNVLLIGALWFPFVLFFFLDTFSIFYLLEASVGYLYGKKLGLGIIKEGRIFGLIGIAGKENEIIRLIENKFIPGGLNYNADQRKVITAEIINLILDTLHQEDMIGEEELRNSRWTITRAAGAMYWDAQVTVPSSFFSFGNRKVNQRISVFLNSLLMDMPEVPLWEKIRTLTSLIPVGPGETLIYDYASIDKQQNTGETELSYLISRYRDEWNKFIARMEKIGKASPAEAQRMRDLNRGQSLGNVNSDLELEVRLWASYRFQPFARTLRGLMHYVQVLRLFAKINHPDWDETQINTEVNKKFQLLWAHQGYGDFVAAHKVFVDPDLLQETIDGVENAKRNDLIKENVDDQDKIKKEMEAAGKNKLNDLRSKTKLYDDTDYLVEYFFENYGYLIDIAYLHKREDGCFYNVFAKYNPASKQIEDQYTIKLTPEFPILSEGKPGNQTHTRRFARGEVIMTIDINQDFYIEQTLKIPHHLELFDAEKVALVGYPEDIFTDSYSLIAQFHAIADRTFVTTVQRMLSLLGARFHYGHPDFWRASYSDAIGGVSRSHPVNEDIYGGYELTLRGLSIIFVETLEGAKAREVSWGTTFGIFIKFAMGAMQQFYDRYLSYLFDSQNFGVLERLAHFFGGIGYYFRKYWVILGNFGYLSFLLVMGVSGFSALPSEIIFGLAGIFIFGQAITFTGFFQYLIDRPIHRGIASFSIVWLMMTPFFMAHVFTYAAGSTMAMMGIATYVATGRGFQLDHPKLSDVLKAYTPTHIFKGFMGTLIAGIGIAIWWNPTLLLSAPFILMMLSALSVPFVYNRGTLPFLFGIKTGYFVKLWKADYKDGWNYVVKQSGIKSNKAGAKMVKDLTAAIPYGIGFITWLAITVFPALLGIVYEKLRAVRENRVSKQASTGKDGGIEGTPDVVRGMSETMREELNTWGQAINLGLVEISEGSIK